MARLPIYVAEQGLDTDRGGTPSTRVDQSLGAAIEGLGGAIAGAGERLLQIQQQREDFAAQVGYQKLQTQLGADLLDVDQNAPADGTGLHDTFIGQRFAARRQEFLNGLPRRLQRQYGLAMDADSEAWSLKAGEAELSRMRANSLTTLGQSLNDTFLPQATRMPDVEALNGLIADADRMVDAAPGLNAAERAEAKRNARASIQQAWVQALPPERRAEAVGVSFGSGSAAADPDADPGVRRRGPAAIPPGGAGAITQVAADLGIAPADLAAVISYETGGTFDPNIKGGKGGNYQGLIQFGPVERQKYGFREGMSFEEQMRGPVAAYLKDRGLKPGMGLAELYSIINAGSLDRFGRPRYSRSDGNGTVAEHIERIAKEHRAPLVAAGFAGAPGGDYTGTTDGGYTVGESQLDALPFDLRLAIARDAQSDLVAQQTAEIKARQAEQDMLINGLMTDIIDGKAGEADVMEARRAGWLTDATDISQALAAIEKRDQDANESQSAIRAVLGPGAAANPYDSDARSLVDKGYQALGGAEGLIDEEPGAGLSSGGPAESASANQRLDGVVANTGIVPKQALNALRAALGSVNPSAALQAYSIAARLYGANQRVFDPYDGGSELRDAAAAFVHLTNDRGLSPQEAAARLQLARSADRVQTEKLLAPQADAFVKELSASDVTADFDPSGLPFNIGGGDPAAGYTPDMEAALLADYSEIAREKFFDAGGDPGVAKAQALAEMHRLYGVTTVGGAPTLMKYPPENYYPPIDGSQDYLREAAMADAAAASGLADATRQPPGAVPGAPMPDGLASAFLVSTGETADDVRHGRPPRYRLFYIQRQDGQNILHEVQDGLFQMPAAEIQRLRQEATDRRRAAFLAGQQDAAAMMAREQAARDEAARALELMPIPGGPAMPVPPPRMSTGGRF